MSEQWTPDHWYQYLPVTWSHLGTCRVMSLCQSILYSHVACHGHQEKCDLAKLSRPVFASECWGTWWPSHWSPSAVHVCVIMDIIVVGLPTVSANYCCEKYNYWNLVVIIYSEPSLFAQNKTYASMCEFSLCIFTVNCNQDKGHFYGTVSILQEVPSSLTDVSSLPIYSMRS